MAFRPHDSLLSSPGPRARVPPLDRDRVLDAALALLDERGLEGVSMRTVASQLGVEAMSLYHHVAGKPGLLDGLHERVLATMPAAPRSPEAPWTVALRERALALRGALRRHPNAVPLFASRPAVTDASLAHVEHALGRLRDGGKTPGEALGIFQSVVALVVGHSLLTLVAHGVEGPDYEALDRETFPRVSEAARQLERRDVEAEFRRALDALLRGFENS